MKQRIKEVESLSDFNFDSVQLEGFEDNSFQTKPYVIEEEPKEKNSENQEGEIEDNLENKQNLNAEENLEGDLEEDTESIDSKEKPTNVSLFKDLFSDLKEREIIKNIELGEEEDLTPERFFEIFEEEKEKEVVQRIANWAEEELDEEAKIFIQFKREGGNTKDFINYLQNYSSIPEGDINDEEYQEDLVRYQLRSEDWEDEEIDETIEVLKRTNKLQDRAYKYESKLKDKKSREEQELLTNRQKEKEQILLEEQKEINTIKESLKKVDEINGITLTSADKDKIFKSLTKKEKVNNMVITPFQKKLAEAIVNPEKKILLAKILENDFDFSSLVVKANTKKVKSIKSNLEKRVYAPKGSSLEGLRPAF